MWHVTVAGSLEELAAPCARGVRRPGCRPDGAGVGRGPHRRGRAVAPASSRTRARGVRSGSRRRRRREPAPGAPGPDATAPVGRRPRSCRRRPVDGRTDDVDDPRPPRRERRPGPARAPCPGIAARLVASDRRSLRPLPRPPTGDGAHVAGRPRPRRRRGPRARGAPVAAEVVARGARCHRCAEPARAGSRGVRPFVPRAPGSDHLLRFQRASGRRRVDRAAPRHGGHLRGPALLRRSLAVGLVVDDAAGGGSVGAGRVPRRSRGGRGTGGRAPAAPLVGRRVARRLAHWPPPARAPTRRRDPSRPSSSRRTVSRPRFCRRSRRTSGAVERRRHGSPLQASMRPSGSMLVTPISVRSRSCATRSCTCWPTTRL